MTLVDRTHHEGNAASLSAKRGPLDKRVLFDMLIGRVANLIASDNLFILIIILLHSIY